ncbi:MAG: hypothetical protein HDQ88_08955 [Clostridia bacterium]|nr:hypothetical protein [Clostridia bacterium]
MKILAHLPTLGLETNPTEDEIEKALQAIFDEQYGSGNTVNVSVQCYMLGYFHAKLIEHVAEHWNDDIKKNFIDAVLDVLPEKPLSKIVPDDINADTLETFNLELAINCLNNTWDRMSPYCTMYEVEGRVRVATLLPESNVPDIESNSGDYALITIAATVA